MKQALAITIAAVPKLIGNGDDPYNNLYWGAQYGVKTYFKKSSDWRPSPIRNTRRQGLRPQRTSLSPDGNPHKISLIRRQFALTLLLGV
jgi:hypothetical protein